MAAAVDTVIWKVRQGERCIPEIAMLKNQLTKDHEWGAGQAVQMFGGGSVEVMKDLAAKQLGF